MPVPTKANVSRPAAQGYDCLIEYGSDPSESLYLRLAVGPGRTMAFQTREPAEENPSTAASPEDMRTESGRSFSRSDFGGGEGLDRAHRRDASERDWTRFWDSRNVDVTPARRGEPAAVRLLHDTALLRAGSVATPRNSLVQVNGSLFFVGSDSTKVDRSDDPTVTVPGWTTEDPFGGGASTDVVDLAGLGSELYAAAFSLGIFKRTAAGVWSVWSTPTTTYQRVWSAKGRILAAEGGTAAGQNLVEVLEDPDADLILHTLAAGEKWTDVVDAGSAVLAAASDGYVYAFADQDGELVLKGQTDFPGEYPTALGYGQGQVFIGTATDTTAGGKIGRLWRAILVGLRLREGQVLREWGDGSTTIDRSPQRIITDRESAWTAVPEDSNETHLWRYHFTTTGLVRDLILDHNDPGASGVAHGMTVVDDRLFVTVEGDGLWREETAYVPSGYLISPLADFFTAARKVWVGARLSTGDLPANTTVTLAYSLDPEAIEDPADLSWTDVVTATAAAPGVDRETPISEAESRWIAGKLELATADTDVTPEVLSFTLRGVPLPTETDYQIPVNVSDRLELPHRRPKLVVGLGEQVRQSLVGLVGKAATVTLLRPDEVVQGQIRAVSEPVEEIPERGSPSVYALLAIRGARQ